MLEKRVTLNNTTHRARKKLVGPKKAAPEEAIYESVENKIEKLHPLSAWGEKVNDKMTCERGCKGRCEYSRFGKMRRDMCAVPKTEVRK